MDASPVVCIVTPKKGVASETFIQAHLDRLPATVHPLFGNYPFLTDDTGRVVAGDSLLDRVGRSLAYRRGKDRDAPRIARFLKDHGVGVVLAEYGPVGTYMLDACRLAGVPLVVHFHGYDAFRRDVLAEFKVGYDRLFTEAARIICVSRHMEAQLLHLGVPPDRLLFSTYGVDTERFTAADPENASPFFFGVGRFVEKKAPYLTLLAFSRIVQAVPEARLTLVGDGPLLGPCRRLAEALHLSHAIELPGARPHQEIAERMRLARGFVQHSLEASDGDCEGTPVAVLEAGASGLPVVSTRHAGIPDVVIEGETGFLVEEGDVDGMAAHLLRIATDPGLAGRMGYAARQHIATNYAMSSSIDRLWQALRQAALAGSPGHA